MNKLFKNYLYNLSYQFLLMLLPIVTTPYISRVLGTNGVGLYNYSYAIISVSLIIAQLGTNIYGQREIAFVQSSREYYSIKFWNIFIIRMISTFAIFPIYIWVSMISGDTRMLMLGMSIYLVANIFDVSWFFQGIEDFKKTAIRSIAVKMMGAFLIFSLVKSMNDILLYAMILGGTQLMGNICLFIYIPKYVDAPKLHCINIKKYIKPILVLFLPTATIYVYTYVDKIILGLLSTNHEVGVYSQPEKIVKLLMTVLTAMGTVLLPHIAVEVMNNNLDCIRYKVVKTITFITCFGLPMVMGAICVAERFIPWFLGEEFLESVFVFKLLSPLIMIIGLASVVGQAIMIPLRMEKIYTVSILCGASINLLFNLITIPLLGAVGASIGTLVAEGTVTLIQFLAVKREVSFSIKECLSNCKNYISGASGMAIILNFLDKLLPKEKFFLLPIIGVGIISYFVYLLLVNDQFLIHMLEIMKRRQERNEDDCNYSS